MKERAIGVAVLAATAALFGLHACSSRSEPEVAQQPVTKHVTRPGSFLGDARRAAQQMVDSGEQIFRFDTFGDEAFWSGQLRIHQSVATLSPKAALDLGLKVDWEALPDATVEALKAGQVDLEDPAVTAALLRANAVLGVVGRFQDEQLTGVGFTCALCHSTVDDSLTSGVGRRVDGMANRDLDVGAIIATAPNLRPVVDLLRLADPSINDETVRRVLRSWGPGKFDAELFLDGKAFQPDGRSAATVLPNARGMAGHNLHTWTGGWGTVSYWNAFVAIIEMHGVGNFYDPRLDNATQYPIAAAAKFGHITVPPEQDRVTSKLPALHFYQLALPAVKPRPNVDFDPPAAERGQGLFAGKGACARCHQPALWTEGGYNAHPASEMRIDGFQADRSPDRTYRTANLAGIFVRERGLFMKTANKGRFYHDGRFATLLDVVESYNQRFNLGLTDAEKTDIVEYMKSL